MMNRLLLLLLLLLLLHLVRVAVVLDGQNAIEMELSSLLQLLLLLVHLLLLLVLWQLVEAERVDAVEAAGRGGRRGLLGLEEHRVDEYLLEDARVGKLDLGLLLLGRVDNAGAADLGELASVAVEVPAADLLGAGRVLDEVNARLELGRHALEQLDVLEQVVVGRARVRVLVVVAVDEQPDAGLVGGGEYARQVALRRDHGDNGRANVGLVALGGGGRCRLERTHALLDERDQRLNAVELGLFE